jgi:hypothetical protein
MTDPGDRPTTTDDAVRAMLGARVERLEPIRFDASLVAADAIGRGRRATRAAPLLPRFAVAVTSLAAVVVLAAVLARPLGDRASSASPPSGGSASLGAGLDSALATTVPTASPPVRAAPSILTPAELGDIARFRSQELDQHLVAVAGTMERDPSVPCARGAICANTLLSDSGGGFHIVPVGDIGPGPWDGSGPKEGAFVLRITARLAGGQPVVEYVGDLVHRDNGTLALSVADILGGQVQIEGAYAAVDGWLVRTPLHPCPTRMPLPSGVTFGGSLRLGCPDDDYVTDIAFQPLQPDGSSLGPRNGIYLPAGSYDQFAPDPAPFGRDNVGVEPRRATYLLRLAASGCGPTADCSIPEKLQWLLVGRLDPIPGLASGPATSSTPSAAADTLPARTVDQLASHNAQTSPGDYVVRAFLVATPPLRCKPVPGYPGYRGPYDCGEFDWLTDEAFQPWTADGTTSSARPPSVGLRVQTGAYNRFAPSPAVGKFGAREPQLGTYLVRLTMHSACEFVLQPSSSPPCTGPNIVLWEVIARLP